MTKLSVITTSRADYTSYGTVLRKMAASRELDPDLIVSGSHLEERFGRTIKNIERDGFRIGAEVPIGLNGDRPVDIVEATSRAIAGYGRAFERSVPGMVVVLGDRFEMHAAALAALHFLIPVVHIHGGELTQGAADDSLRHGITKLSHLHFAATAEYGKRIVRLGEEPWRVVVSGAPSLDNLKDVKLYERAEIEEILDLQLDDDPLLVTYHPATLDPSGWVAHLDSLLDVLMSRQEPIVFTAPNADIGGQQIRERISLFVRSKTGSVFVENLGTEGYFSLMAIAKAMVGNSSSGIIEAASFKLPVLNVGERQLGRTAGRNVVSVGGSSEAIRHALEKVTSGEFRAGLEGLLNPYGSGHAAEVIVERLVVLKDDPRLMEKRFYEGPVERDHDAG